MRDAGNAVSAASVVAEARRWIGTPYRHQGSTRGVGADCLGLIRGVWRGLNANEPCQPPPYTRDWAETGEGDALLHAARKYLLPITGNTLAAGNVVVFRPKLRGPAKHIAVLSGPLRMIHAQEGYAVAEVSIGLWWRRRIAGVFAFPDPNAAEQRRAD